MRRASPIRSKCIEAKVFWRIAGKEFVYSSSFTTLISSRYEYRSVRTFIYYPAWGKTRSPSNYFLSSLKKLFSKLDGSFVSMRLIRINLLRDIITRRESNRNRMRNFNYSIDHFKNVNVNWEETKSNFGLHCELHSYILKKRDSKEGKKRSSIKAFLDNLKYHFDPSKVFNFSYCYFRGKGEEREKKKLSAYPIDQFLNFSPSKPIERNDITKTLIPSFYTSLPLFDL